jgi:hypothetical protein
VAPSYDFLETLPTDPEALREYVYDTLHVTRADDPDQAAFDLIGGVVGQSMLPPDLAAAFYRVAAEIPGVVLDEGVEDGQGRSGMALARDSERHGSRTEWVFDEDTFAFLGRNVIRLTDEGDGIEPGTVVYSETVAERAVVDEPREVPDEQPGGGAD